MIVVHPVDLGPDVEGQKPAVFKFFQTAHHDLGHMGVSFGAIVALPGDRARLLVGDNPTDLEAYIREAIPEHLEAEVFKLESIQ